MQIFCDSLLSLILVFLVYATKAALCHLQALPSCVAPDRLHLRLSMHCATQHALFGCLCLSNTLSVDVCLRYLSCLSCRVSCGLSEWKAQEL